MRVLAVVAVSALLCTGSLWAQAPKGGAVVGFMHAIHATNNVEKTLAFYTQVFGLTTEIRPFANAAVPILTNSPGVSLRVAMLRIPGNGLNFELTEFSNTQRNPAQPRITDPGAPHMKFLVRNLDEVVTKVKAAGAPIITKSGAPVTVKTAAGSVRAIFFRDPDGYIVEAVQADGPAPEGVTGNVVGAIMGETIGTMETSMKFWRDMMGLPVASVPAFSRDAAMTDLMGLPDGAEFRTVSSVFPGSKARIEFTEFKGAPGTPFSLRVPDPGASGMAIRVADIEGLMPKMKAAGIRIISKDGALVKWSDTILNVFVKDPDGLNIELVGEAGK